MLEPSRRGAERLLCKLAWRQANEVQGQGADGVWPLSISLQETTGSSPWSFIFTGIFIFLFATVVFAESEIKAEVDKTSITTDELLTYKVVITSSEKNLPPLQVPKFEGFSVVSQAQSSTISFAKSKVKTILVYAYILAPTDKGKFKIEASQVKMKDQVYTSAAFEIEVKQGKLIPKRPLKQAPAQPQENLPESKGPQTTL